MCEDVWICEDMFGYVQVCMDMYFYEWIDPSPLNTAPGPPTNTMYEYVLVCMGMYGYQQDGFLTGSP